jgi:putative tricarboxylic transport membrane protein
MPGRRRRLWFAWLLGAALLLAACGTSGDDGGGSSAGAAANAGWTPQYVNGKLQPLPDGFPDREMSMIVSDNPTSAEAILMRHLLQAAQKISPVPIRGEIREDFEAFGSWEALDYINNAEGGKEGYVQMVFGTPGGLVDLHSAPVTDELGLGKDDLGEIITLENRPYLIVQCADVAWEPTWESLMTQIKNNPGKVRVMGGAPGTNTDLVFAYYIDQLGVGNLYDKADVNLINVGGIAERVTAVAACEGDVTVSTIEAAQPHIQSGRLDVILVTGAEKLKGYENVPLSTEVGITEDPAQSTKQVVVPASVDATHIRWLYELYAKAAADPEYVKARGDIPGVHIGIQDPAGSQQVNDLAFDKFGVLTEKLGINISQLGK